MDIWTIFHGPSGVAYDRQHELNPFSATLALPGADVRSSEQGSPEALRGFWGIGLTMLNWTIVCVCVVLKWHLLVLCSGNK